MVIQGQGPVVRFAGGHSKIGELIARAVHAGVTQAVSRQNGLRADRDLFQRLANRKLSPGIIAGYVAADDRARVLVAEKLETLLAMPFYASFVESALALSDDYEKGLIKELIFFDEMCRTVTARLAGRPD